ncbi:acetate kinase [Porphyromonas pogonae]|uniref:acetate/propionate family kinase n=1 Tax=Porphyromonas pogonae TaxID=867595 RepID=UPI002E767BC7|nr:acetate kinase [Porphyromonas pogonae]
MKVLVLNCGSSSVKYMLIDMPQGDVLAQGGVEKLGLPGSFLKFKMPNGEKVQLEKDMPDHTVAVEFILSTLMSEKYGCIKSFDEIEAVGHRLVHGGNKFSESVAINQEVIEKLRECIDLAPLHNGPNLMGIEAIMKLLPNIRQVGVFDTAFHQTMPDYAYMYALPYEMYEKYGVRRYGFHGTSHRYVSKKGAELAGLDYKNCKIITAHIGNGASMTAIVNGKSIDCSMGFTPTEGLMMGTRCGDVDPGALAFIADKEELDGKGLSDLVNKQSGVMGVSGVSSDMREIEEAINGGNKRAMLSMEMYNYRIKKYIGAYAAAMGGVDLIIFTGGVGENQWTTREIVCEGLEFMGIKVDKSVNTELRGKDAVISAADSRVKIMVVPTDEEYMIAKDTMDILS